MKKLKRTYTRCALTAALVLLVMLIAGSIWDLPISKFLYPGHESSIGQFFAAFGELPAFSLLAGCGVLLIVHRAKFRPVYPPEVRGPLRPHDEQCRAQRIGQRVIRRHDRH